MTTTAEATRFCEGCLNDLPLVHFRRRSRDSSARMHRCNRCHATAERERRSKRRTRLNGKRIGWFARSLKRAKSDDAVLTLCGRMVAQYGGIEPLTKQWVSHWRAAPLGSKRALGGMESLVRMIQSCDAARERRLKGSTNEELDALVRHHLDRYVAENPAVAVQAALRLGWRVRPPKGLP